MIHHHSPDWLEGRTILYVVHGSRAYGTSRPDSDYDYKGCAIAPRSYRDGFLRVFEQAENKSPDSVVYDLRKFFRLAADCNPNIIEVMWGEREDRLICMPLGARLIDAREAFLSKKALHTFRGYAISQLRRIDTHRRWLLTPPTAPPTRSEFGLPERTVIPADQLSAAMANVQRVVDGWEVDFGDMDSAGKIYVQEQIHRYMAEAGIGSDERWLAAGRLLGHSENFLELMDKERRYNTAQKNWAQYQNWRATRNEGRASLEAKHGYDTKHAGHLVRLLRMCREILTEGVVRVRRPDAAELLSIRDGAWSYERLAAWADEQDAELVEVAQSSSLPKIPDRVALDDLCQEITRAMDSGNA